MSSSEHFISNGAGNVVCRRAPVQPTDSQILIRTEYAGVNRGDVLGLTGAYGEPTPAGQRVGQDVVGIVEQAGSEEGAALVGQRVFGQVSGAWGQQVTADASAVAPVGQMDPVVAATLPLAGFTALRLARQAYQLTGDFRGKNILITGGTGAVGGMLSEILASQGATVWLPTRQPRTSQDARIRYVNAIEEVPVVAVAFESVGSTSMAQALRRLAQHGHLWWFGGATRQPVTLDFFSYLERSPLHVHHFAHWVHDGRDVDDLKQLHSLVEAGVIAAPRHHLISPNDLPDAINGIAGDRVHDKVIIRY